MSLRRRLTLSLVTILILFAVNVGTHFWGSYARNESMEAYRDSVSAAQLSTEVEQLLNDQRQQILVLSTLRDNTGDQMEPEETEQALEGVDGIQQRVRQLGRLSPDVTRLHADRLQESSRALLDEWREFYRNYNDPEFSSDVRRRNLEGEVWVKLRTQNKKRKANYKLNNIEILFCISIEVLFLIDATSCRLDQVFILIQELAPQFPPLPGYVSKWQVSSVVFYKKKIWRIRKDHSD